MSIVYSNVYFNKDLGYLITSHTTRVDCSRIYVTLNNPLVAISSILDSDLGNLIKSALDITRKATPISREEADNYKFWQITGIKGFATFSKKFRMANVVETADGYEITERKRDKQGAYIDSEDDVRIKLSLSSTDKEIGNAIQELFSDVVEFPNDMYRTFETVHENTFHYLQPSDNFNDIGDGHTDAYQIFTLDGDDNNYIAFLIDSGYKSFGEEDIMNKWKQWYSNLSSFKYEIQNNSNIALIVTANADNQKITSYFYKDGDSYLEVMLQYTYNKQIEEELKKVISSISIQNV